jgi:glycosyltransferase involved in cell wall biosynthesis
MEAYPTGLHRVLERRRMRRLLREASAIVMTTNEAVRQLLDAFPELCDRPVIAIPNGFDAADFLAADDASPEAGGDTFRIVHAGYLHTEAGLKQRRRSLLHKVLRGTVPGVDILTRTHLFLLAAITLLLEQDPSIGDCLELHLAGVISKLGIEFARTSPVTKIHGYVTHAQAIGLIKSADLLFLPMQNLTDGRRSSTVPGKTYEYLASGRPILGAVPPGDARDLLERSGHAVCAPDDVEGIAAHIRSAMLDHARHGRRPSDPSFGEAFERRELAGQLADLLWLVAGAEAGAVTRRSLSHA